MHRAARGSDGLWIRGSGLFVRYTRTVNKLASSRWLIAPCPCVFVPCLPFGALCGLSPSSLMGTDFVGGDGTLPPVYEFYFIVPAAADRPRC